MSTTPAGTPPQDFISLNEQAANAAVATAAAPSKDTSAILKALADMAKSNTAVSGLPSQASTNNVTNPQNAVPQNLPSFVNQPPVGQAVSVPGTASGVTSFAGLNSATPNFPQNLLNGQTNMQAVPSPIMPQGNGNGPVTPESLQQQLQILQALQAQGVPQDQWATVLSVLMSSGAGMASNGSFVPQPTWPQNGNYSGRGEPSRDRNGYNDQSVRSPTNRYRNPRSRSRSPPGWDRRREPSPPRRRDSPVYDEYSGDRNGGRGNAGRQGKGRGRGSEYRQRSPAPDRFRRSPSPRRQEFVLPPPGPKWMEYDRSLGDSTIKGKLQRPTMPNQTLAHNETVLSRTLFVGGVT